MGKRTRARNASWSRCRRLTNPRPAPTATSSVSFRPLAQRVPVVGGPSQPEAAYHLAVVPPAAQVVPGLAGVGRGQQPLVVPLGGLLHGVEEHLAALTVPTRRGVLADGDAGLVGQAADGVDEVEVLDGPHETDGVALGLAAEAVVEAVLGVDAERWGLLPVERAQALPPAAHLLECGVLTDQGDDVGLGPDPRHVLVGDAHGSRRYRVVDRHRPDVVIRGRRPTPAGRGPALRSAAHPGGGDEAALPQVHLPVGR